MFHLRDLALQTQRRALKYARIIVAHPSYALVNTIELWIDQLGSIKFNLCACCTLFQLSNVEFKQSVEHGWL